MQTLNGKEAQLVRVDVYPASGRRVEHFSNGVSFTGSMTAQDYQSTILALYATIEHMRKEATNANK